MDHKKGLTSEERVARVREIMAARKARLAADAGSKRPVVNSAVTTAPHVVTKANYSRNANAEIARLIAMTAPNAGSKRPVENAARPAYVPPPPLSRANANAIADMNTFLNQYRRFENIHVNLPERLIYASRHPGYKYVNTSPDGSCMYYAIYFAQHPDEDTNMKNQTKDKALQIRQIVADSATIQDVQAFTGDDLDFSIIREGDRNKKAELLSIQDEVGRVNGILQTRFAREVEITPEMIPLLEEKLDLYKQLLLLHSFWGQNREIAIFNRYVRSHPELDLKQIYVWVDPLRRYENYIPGGAPIFFDGVGHYSILKPIKGREATRTAENERASTYLTTYEAATQKEQELRTAWKTKYGDEPRKNKGGSRKRRATKKRLTRKH